MKKLIRNIIARCRPASLRKKPSKTSFTCYDSSKSDYDSSKSTSFMLNVAFDVVLNTVFGNLLEYKDYKNILLFAQLMSFDMNFLIKS